MANVLVVIESPSKKQLYESILSAAGLNRFRIVATKGRLFDIPGNELGIDRSTLKITSYEPVRPSVVKYLKEQIAESREVIALTDLDPEGELIAYEIKSICKSLSKPFRRLRPSALTESSIQDCLDSNEQDVDQKIVERCLARRVVDRLIGHASSFRVGRIVSPALSILSQGNPGESKNYITRDRWIADSPDNVTTDPIEISKVSEERDERPYPTGPEWHSKISQFFDWPVERTTLALQSAYEHGTISYHRTQSRTPDSYAKRKAAIAGREMGIAVHVQDAPADGEPHGALFPLSDCDLAADYRLCSDETAALQYIWRYIEHYFNRQNTPLLEKGVDRDTQKTYHRHCKSMPGLSTGTRPISLEFPEDKSGELHERSDLYLMNLMLKHGLGTPSTLPDHASSISKSFIREDLTLKPSLDLHLDKARSVSEGLVDVMTIRALENKIETSSGAYYEIAKEALIASGLALDLGAITPEENATIEHLSRLGLDF